MSKLWALLLLSMPCFAQTATPVIALPSGMYTMPTSSAITDSTSGNAISYCYSAAAITSCSGHTVTPYTMPVFINPSVSETLCAYAIAAGVQSATTCNTWTPLLAIGDSRAPITEPMFPTGCLQFQATKTIGSSTLFNLDPYNSTCTGSTYPNGSLGCTGGTSLEPSSETLDNGTSTTGFQGALNSTSSSCVEVVPGSSGQNALVLAPWTLPTGTTLLIDAGLTLFASRNAADYNSGGTCGVLSAGGKNGGINGSNCLPWITATNTNNSAIMGYGWMDLRGWDKFTSAPSCPTGLTCGFYVNTIYAYCALHGGTKNGSPVCPSGSTTSSSNAYASPPYALDLKGASNFTIYKTTIKDQPGFGIYWGGSNSGSPVSGFTCWGCKQLAPFEVSNTDCFDPTNNAQNFSMINWSVSCGDDDTAMKASAVGFPVKYGSYLGVHKYSGLGLSVGSSTLGGISSIFFNGVFCSGPVGTGSTVNDAADTCIKIKSPDSGIGGTVNNITYNDVYIQNSAHGIYIYPYYSCVNTSGSPAAVVEADVPLYSNLVFSNVTFGTNAGSMTFQGWDSTHKTSATFNNVTKSGTYSGPVAPSSCPDYTTPSGDAYGAWTYGPGPVDSGLVTQLQAGTGTTFTDNRSTSPAAYTATAQPLQGELNLQIGAVNNLQCPSTSPPCTYSGATAVTLQAILQTGAEVSSQEAYALTNASPPTVTFYDSINGGTPGALHTSPIGGNGTLASYATTLTPGLHLITATYPGDSHYSAYTFGNVYVQIGSPSPIISPGAGAYTSPQTISISDSGATTIWYTTDGSTPTAGGGTSTSYSSPFSLALAATVKAIAVFTGGTSSVSSNSYTVSGGGGGSVAPAAFSPFNPGP